jgi:hypothetical protein
MRMKSMVIVLAGLLAASYPALAQQKTEKECRIEWQANKLTNRAAKIKEKAYVDQCRLGGETTQPAATPAAAKPAPTPAAPAGTPKPTGTPHVVRPAPSAATAPAAPISSRLKPSRGLIARLIPLCG